MFFRLNLWAKAVPVLIPFDAVDQDRAVHISENLPADSYPCVSEYNEIERDTQKCIARKGAEAIGAGI